MAGGSEVVGADVVASPLLTPLRSTVNAVVGVEVTTSVGVVPATRGVPTGVPDSVVESAMAPATLDKALFVSDTSDARAVCEVVAAAVVEFPKGVST